jgi:hypothetical protein
VAGDAALRERFVAEVRTLARLSHPNVVPVYDVGMHDELYRQAARGLIAAHAPSGAADRAGHFEQAVAMVHRAKRTLGDEPSEPGLAESIDAWLLERTGEVKR